MCVIRILNVYVALFPLLTAVVCRMWTQPQASCFSSFLFTPEFPFLGFSAEVLFPPLTKTYLFCEKVQL